MGCQWDVNGGVYRMFMECFWNIYRRFMECVWDAYGMSKTSRTTGKTGIKHRQKTGPALRIGVQAEQARVDAKRRRAKRASNRESKRRRAKRALKTDKTGKVAANRIHTNGKARDASEPATGTDNRQNGTGSCKSDQHKRESLGRKRTGDGQNGTGSCKSDQHKRER